jgi:hypothetical protein
MASYLSKLVVYSSVLFDVGRDVRRWAEATERGFTYNAKEAAPSRSGHLRANIWGYVERIGPKHLQTIIRSDAHYTMYVLGGTQGPIMSDSVWNEEEEQYPMILRHGTLGGKKGSAFGKAWVVSGQSPQNFFADAAEATARRHFSLRGFEPDVQTFRVND